MPIGESDVPEGKAALSSYSPILLTPSTRTADAASDYALCGLRFDSSNVKRIGFLRCKGRAASNK